MTDIDPRPTEELLAELTGLPAQMFNVRTEIDVTPKPTPIEDDLLAARTGWPCWETDDENPDPNCEDVDRWVIEVPQDWLDADGGWPAEVRLESPDGRVAECEVVGDE